MSDEIQSHLRGKHSRQRIRDGNVLPPQKPLAMGRALCLHPRALSVSLGTHTKEVESFPVSSSLLSDESAAAPHDLCCDGATQRTMGSCHH